MLRKLHQRDGSCDVIESSDEAVLVEVDASIRALEAYLDGRSPVTFTALVNANKRLREARAATHKEKVE